MAKGIRLKPQQIVKLRKHLDRVGESDIRIGTCRHVAKGVQICRIARKVYVRTSKRHVPKSEWG